MRLLLWVDIDCVYAIAVVILLLFVVFLYTGSESKMRGKEVMSGLSEPKSCSWKKTLKGCNMKGEFGNFVLIDDDGDRPENVIVIDATESVGEDLQGSSGSICYFRGQNISLLT